MLSFISFCGLENSKPFSIMNFGPEDNKQKYDFFGNQSKLLLSEPIMATVILYLTNVSQGGQLLFPESEVRMQLYMICCYCSYPAVNNLFFQDSHSESSHATNMIWSDCTKSSNANLQKETQFFSLTSILMHHLTGLVLMLDALFLKVKCGVLPSFST